jgi:hypothetical protein
MIHVWQVNSGIELYSVTKLVFFLSLVKTSFAQPDLLRITKRKYADKWRALWEKLEPYEVKICLVLLQLVAVAES